MTGAGSTDPARTPPAGLPGLHAAWSRLVPVDLPGEGTRTFHLLSRPARTETPRFTVVCVHGNPSWSYLWRNVLASAPEDVRVIAPDHLDMGFSERTGTVRPLAQRISDLTAVLTAAEVTGPVVVLAHDWGGPISLGWAQQHQLGGILAADKGPVIRGLVLLNTAVHQPAEAAAPSIIRLARSGPLLPTVAERTDLFVRGGFWFSRPLPPAEIREAFRAPYLTAERRTAVAEFVRDIPLEPDHRSAQTLDAIAAGLGEFGEVPSLLVWGARDIVFSDRYLHDLEARLPHAQVHRHPKAGHFVSEEIDLPSALWSWCDQHVRVGLDSPGELPSAPPPALPAPAGLDPDHFLRSPEHAERLAILEMSGDRQRATFGELNARIDRTVAAYAQMGIVRGDRVALMIPPGIELATCLHACWRAGAVAVLVDGGLPAAAINSAVRAAAPDHLIGIDRAMAAAGTLQWPGRRWSVGGVSRPIGVLTEGRLEDVRAQLHEESTAETAVDLDDEAAVIFTSGSTGPSKGVVYRHRQVRAQLAALQAQYGITEGEALVAAFAPFALYGPSLGIASAVPDMDVTAPSTLTWDALEAAILAVKARLVFASPAAIANACAPGSARDADAMKSVRLVLSAGAPVADHVLELAQQRFPEASIETPYGMTELLPVSNVSLGDRRTATTAATAVRGVCVGRPVPGARVMLETLDSTGGPTGDLLVTGSADPGEWGEIIVRAPHQRDGYDRLWQTTAIAERHPGWHCTGDVGSVDAEGLLWVSGRVGHVVATADGLIAPVGPEMAIVAIDGIVGAALVGVGPSGAQVPVAVVQLQDPTNGPAVRLELIDQVRAATQSVLGERPPLAAVLQLQELPTDRRHNAKVDRSRLATWAHQILSGDQVAKP